MKILRVTSLGYVGGGLETGIELLQPVLEGMGHEVRILTSDHNPSVPHWSDYEFPALSSVPFPLRVLYRAWYPAAYRKLREVIEEYQPDVVQFHSFFELSPAVLFAVRDVPAVVTVHGAEDFTKELLLWAFPTRLFRSGKPFTRAGLTVRGWLHYLYHRYISMPLFRKGFQNVERVVVFSAYMQAMLARDHIESVCVPNATVLFAEAPLPEGDTILFVGRLEKIKGVQVLLDALPAVRAEHPGARLVIAGSGPYEPVLREQAKLLQLDSLVTFAGQVGREKLEQLYRSASVVAVPSLWPEPFGKVGIEAMSVGRPVVASDVGGMSEWLRDGETGYLVKPGSPSELGEALCRVLRDRGRLDEMGQAARKRAEDFSIEAHAAKIIEVYEEARHEFKVPSS